jgi:Reverse transcriptase (RNA-dependent DNA polymerase)
MEEMLKDWIETIRAYNPGGTILSKAARRSRLTVVRFADDFVVLHPELEVIREAQNKISTWLSAMGLELHPDKTSIRHTFLAQPRALDSNSWVSGYATRENVGGGQKEVWIPDLHTATSGQYRVLRQIKKVLFTIRDRR